MNGHVLDIIAASSLHTIQRVALVQCQVSPPSKLAIQDRIPSGPLRLNTVKDNIHPMQPSHAEDDRLHNSDVAMQQAKIARYQV